MRTYKHIACFALLYVFVSVSGQANPVDDAYRKADARSGNKVELSVAASVRSDIARARSALGAQVDETDRRNKQRQAEQAAAGPSSTNSNPSTAATGSAWKIVRQYEGGFSEFGFDTRHTIFVVRCRSGAEHKLYRDKNGKWGSVGAGFNNSAASLEMAASQKCN
ncbi:hypothetical protein ABT392_04515 [Paucibacter sp. JuS9]|uniref:hypothetical protein n=1 Tax=Paucibacter sp. JuS9 TaxID=3228748 RepID=UPI00375786C7